MIFSERLKQLRLEKGLTQKEVADLVNVNRVTYTNWEKGNREPSFEKLFLLAESLGTNIDYLLGNSDNPKKSTTQDEDINFSARYIKDFLYVIYGSQRTMEEFSVSSEEELLEKIKLKMKEIDDGNTQISVSDLFK
ncbi:helix-turn-helix domain-containing protein [Streptococcus infantis]|uniref:helix-turn-helix domain-containing protein n=1 Tax=Streptococcus infantis TaxID=68892 RepID=UPI0039C1F689